MKESIVIVIIASLLVALFAFVLILQVTADDSRDDIAKYDLIQGDYLRFHVVGDYGELRESYKLKDGTWPVEHVADSMRTVAQSKPISMVISCGDNMYNLPNGSFDDRQFRLMHDIFDKGSLAMKPWYLVLGNHDCYSKLDDSLDLHQLYPM